jgi:hypothetical protein
VFAHQPIPHYVDFIPQKITRCGGEQGSLMLCTRRALGVTSEIWWALGWYQRFFYWRIFTKFQPQKYDLDLYKDFSWKK